MKEDRLSSSSAGVQFSLLSEPGIKPAQALSLLPLSSLSPLADILVWTLKVHVEALVGASVPSFRLVSQAWKGPSPHQQASPYSLAMQTLPSD